MNKMQTPYAMQGSGGSRIINGQEFFLKQRFYVVELAHDAVADSNLSGTIQIDPGIPFLLHTIHVSDTGDPTTAAPGLEGQYENYFQFQDLTSGYLFSNIPVTRSSFAGSRQFPNRLPDEVIFLAGTRLQITATNPHTGAAATTSKVELEGWALYPVPPHN
jgi:hypothetical protein